MGRFDELQQLDQMPRPPLPPTVEKRARVEEKARKPADGQADKPAPPQNTSPTEPHAVVTAKPLSRRPTYHHLSPTDGEIPEKYTTRLRPSMVRQVKIFAAERDLNDYEVVETALTEYFEKNK